MENLSLIIQKKSDNSPPSLQTKCHRPKTPYQKDNLSLQVLSLNTLILHYKWMKQQFSCTASRTTIIFGSH